MTESATRTSGVGELRKIPQTPSDIPLDDFYNGKITSDITETDNKNWNPINSSPRRRNPWNTSPQILRSILRNMKKLLDIVPSTWLFFLSAAACLGVGIYISTLKFFTGDESWASLASRECQLLQDSGHSADYTSAVDGSMYSSHIFTSGLTSKWQAAFMIDIKTPATLSLLQARSIDVLWNLFAGQGVRLLMGYVMYRVCCDILVIAMKDSKISYDLFTSVTLVGPSFETAIQVSRQPYRFSTVKKFKQMIVFFFLTIALIWTLAITSLLDVAAGYITPTVAWWEIEDNVLVPNIAEAINTCFTVADGSRIGLTDNITVIGPSVAEWELVHPMPIGSYYEGCGNYTSGHELYDEISTYYCGLVSAYYSIKNETRGGAFNINLTSFWDLNTEITINGSIIEVPSPPLHLSLSGIGVSNWTSYYNLMLSSSIWGRCYQGKPLMDEWTPDVYCVSTANGYAWGFSHYVTMSILFVQAGWIILVFLLWTYARSKAVDENGKSIFRGPYKAAVELVKSMEGDLDDLDKNNDVLRQELEKTKGIGLTRRAGDDREALFSRKHQR